MKTYNNLWKNITSYENLELAFFKARKRKTKKHYVMKFEKNLKENLLQLRKELTTQTYRPMPLKTFILKDPKTRKISVSDFRDRIIHHALCNVIEPLFEECFIYDSYANRKKKGPLTALKRFDCFKRKATHNNTRNCYVLKADIKHYFDTVDHEILVDILRTRIKDENALWLVKRILKNHGKNRGMPLGNHTSQFFANVYLNHLDQYVKKELKAKHYIRYVDDFVILSNNKVELELWKIRIINFLKSLKLELHPEKSKIINLNRGINFLGFRVFYHHKLLRKSNIRKMQRKMQTLKLNISDYDKSLSSMESWISYAKHGNTYNLRKSFTEEFTSAYPGKIALVEISRWQKHNRTCI
ncbi:reverse transcriptase domain-containing protein [Nanoarchaeota archaeon]